VAVSSAAERSASIARGGGGRSGFAAAEVDEPRPRRVARRRGRGKDPGEVLGREPVEERRGIARHGAR